MIKDNCTLKAHESHPAAKYALDFIAGLGPEKCRFYLEMLSSCAPIDNHLAEICAETLRRILSSRSVSDRYLLGLAWTLKEIVQTEDI